MQTIFLNEKRQPLDKVREIGQQKKISNKESIDLPINLFIKLEIKCKKRVKELFEAKHLLLTVTEVEPKNRNDKTLKKKTSIYNKKTKNNMFTTCLILFPQNNGFFIFH